VIEFLHSIRRAYLSMEGGVGRRTKTDSGNEKKEALDSWKGSSSLTDKERDEIQYQVKVMIKRCLARIKELEKGEEGECAVH
jgi:syntaxin 18